MTVLYISRSRHLQRSLPEVSAKWEPTMSNVDRSGTESTGGETRSVADVRASFDRRRQGSHVSSVLLIDDSEGDALLAELVIKENLSDADVEHAPDGQTGLDRLQLRGYDLVILDLSMPGLDGFDVLEALRKRSDFTSRVVVMSSSIRPSDKARVESYGCEYVEKHTDFGTFRQSMTRTLVA